MVNYMLVKNDDLCLTHPVTVWVMIVVFSLCPLAIPILLARQPCALMDCFALFNRIGKNQVFQWFRLFLSKEYLLNKSTVLLGRFFLLIKSSSHLNIYRFMPDSFSSSNFLSLRIRIEKFLSFRCPACCHWVRELDWVSSAGETSAVVTSWLLAFGCTQLKIVPWLKESGLVIL